MSRHKKFKPTMPTPRCRNCPMGVRSPLSKSVCLVCISIENDRLQAELSETKQELREVKRELFMTKKRFSMLEESTALYKPELVYGPSMKQVQDAQIHELVELYKEATK